MWKVYRPNLLGDLINQFETTYKEPNALINCWVCSDSRHLTRLSQSAHGLETSSFLLPCPVLSCPSQSSLYSAISPWSPSLSISIPPTLQKSTLPSITMFNRWSRRTVKYNDPSPEHVMRHPRYPYARLRQRTAQIGEHYRRSSRHLRRPSRQLRMPKRLRWLKNLSVIDFGRFQSLNRECLLLYFRSWLIVWRLRTVSVH